jgi:16S rRNA (adenine1518-N6/adenine1519-N6)-dimethyltransferase
VLVQLACEVELLRTVNRAVFVPRPRVDSALLRLRRRGPAPSDAVRRLVQAAFAHRRKSLARSVELAGAFDRGRARAGLRKLDLREDVRAEALWPRDFVELAAVLGEDARVHG